MKIRKIKLQNIKSYSEQELTFYEGVNFISGINGAGKSTLIEAVGYALFDYNPYANIRDFIRYGAKSGSITVDFFGNDEREYTVIRKIGTSSLWTVFDRESGGELDLHGNKDVKEWLKEVLGIDQDIELDQLFRDVIGVPQGTFVAPFLETPTLRKKKFDGILKVEQYREAFNNTVKTASELNKRILHKENELSLLMSKVEDYANIKKEVSLLEDQKSQLSAKLNDLEIKIKSQEVQIKNLEDIRTQLEGSHSQLKAFTEKEKGLLQRHNDIKVNLERSITANKLVTSSEAGYLGYLEMDKNLKALENKRAEKEKIDKEYNQLKQDLASLEAKIKEKEASIARQELDLVQNKTNINNQIVQLNEHLNIAHKDLVAAEQQINHSSTWKQAEEDLGSLAANLELLCRDLKSITENHSNLVEEEIQLNQKLAGLTEIKAIADTYESKETAYLNARKEYDLLKEQLVNIENNHQKLKDGKCPILGTDCLNITENPTEFFNQQSETVKKQMATIQELGLALRKEFDTARESREKVSELLGHQERLKQVTEQKSSIIKDVSLLRNKIKELQLEKSIQSLINQSCLTFNRSQEAFSSLREMLSMDIITSGAVNTDQFLSCLEDILKESKEKRSTLEKFQTETYNIKSSKLAALQAEILGAQKFLAELTNKEMNIENEKNELKKSRQLHINQKNNNDELESKLSSFVDLLEDLDKYKKQQSSFNKDYKTYISNKLESDKLNTLKEYMTTLCEEIDINKLKIKDLEIAIEMLSEKFNSADYEKAKSELDIKKQEKATETQNLLERINDIRERQEKLQEMDKIIKKIDTTNHEIVEIKNTRSLLDLVRNIFNSAGPPIAKIYLENLSREANELHRQVSRENVVLEWKEGYDIVLVDNFNGSKRERNFKQFSGGEQMTAALAVRLALLKQQSRVKVGFFDEPTQNLDSERRMNLAETIPSVTRGFDQIFIISHDDTFDGITENVIQLHKDEGNGTNKCDS